MFLSHIDVSLSLPAPLSKINKKIFLDEDKKPQNPKKHIKKPMW